MAVVHSPPTEYDNQRIIKQTTNMKMIYTHENRFFVHNVQNIIEAAHIETYLKNEFAAGASGDLAPIDAWLELWVVNDEDYLKSLSIIDSISNGHKPGTWTCSHCQEVNDNSFDFCWKCQRETQEKIIS